MPYTISIDAGSARPKYRQIADCLLEGIRSRAIGVAEQLPSINAISATYDVSRDTVERAYKLLKREGIIESVRGKGYYARRDAQPAARRVLVVFNKLSDHKREIYDALTQTLGDAAEVTLRVYCGAYSTFASLIESSASDYDDFVIVTNFLGAKAQRARDLLNATLAARSVVFVSNDMPGHAPQFGAVTQHYERDIVAGLKRAQHLLAKYTSLGLLFDPDCAARGIIQGFLRFSEESGFDAEVETTETAPGQLVRGRAYVTITDRQLVQLVKSAREAKLTLGRDIGIVAYNDSALKEVLVGGVTVVTTDHEAMGERAARMLLEGNLRRERVPFRLIERATL